jgi:nucleotidyltransferase-like protein
VDQTGSAGETHRPRSESASRGPPQPGSTAQVHLTSTADLFSSRRLAAAFVYSATWRGRFVYRPFRNVSWQSAWMDQAELRAQYTALLDRVRDDERVLGVVLSGSQARQGTATERSDYDVLIVVADDQGLTSPQRPDLSQGSTSPSTRYRCSASMLFRAASSHGTDTPTRTATSRSTLRV